MSQSLLLSMKDTITSQETSTTASDKFHLLDNQLQHLLTEYNCKNVDDRVRVSNTNMLLQNHFSTNRTILNIQQNSGAMHFRDILFHEDYFIRNLRYANYDNFYITHKPSGKLKNHIWIQSSCESVTMLDEIVLNVNYTIISDTVDYAYRVPVHSFDEAQLDEVEYILYDHLPITDSPHITTTRMSDFLAQHMILFRICTPSFTCLNSRLTRYIENKFSDKCWEVRMDKYLCNKYLQDNFHVFIHYAYSLIYSATSRTDLVRHLLLFKHGGCYLDISVKIISPEFPFCINSPFLQK